MLAGDPVPRGAERGAAVEGGGRARRGRRRGRGRRAEAAAGPVEEAVQPSPVRVATSARGEATQGGAADERSRAASAGSPARGRARGRRARRARRGARRWRGGGAARRQEAEGRAATSTAARTARPRSAAPWRPAGGSTSPGAGRGGRPGCRRAAGPSGPPPGRGAEQAEQLRAGRLAGADRQDRGVEALLPGEELARGGCRRRRRGCRGRGCPRGRARPASGRRRRRCGLGREVSWAEGSWTSARTRSLPRAMPVRIRSVASSAPSKSETTRSEPVVGDDPGGFGQRGVEAAGHRRRPGPRRRGRGCGRRRGRGGGARRRVSGARGRWRFRCGRGRGRRRSPAEDAPGGEGGDFGGGDGLHVEDGAKEHRLALVDEDERRAVAFLAGDADVRAPVRAVTFQSMARTSSPGR